MHYLQATSGIHSLEDSLLWKHEGGVWKRLEEEVVNEYDQNTLYACVKFPKNKYKYFKSLFTDCVSVYNFKKSLCQNMSI